MSEYAVKLTLIVSAKLYGASFPYLTSEGSFYTCRFQLGTSCGCSSPRHRGFLWAIRLNCAHCPSFVCFHTVWQTHIDTVCSFVYILLLQTIKESYLLYCSISAREQFPEDVYTRYNSSVYPFVTAVLITAERGVGVNCSPPGAV